MELFERILYLVEMLANNSQAKFARTIGAQQTTFNGYLNREGQRKIRKALLDEILIAYPKVSRDWLYFGEGEAFHEGVAKSAPTLGRVAELEAQVNQLQEELADERRLSRQLTAKLLIDGVGDKGAVTSIGKAADGHE